MSDKNQNSKKAKIHAILCHQTSFLNDFGSSASVAKGEMQFHLHLITVNSFIVN
jgi:hypothetical protein